MSGVFSTDPKATDFYARTDSRLFIVKDTDWFIFPYPGMKFMSLMFSPSQLKEIILICVNTEFLFHSSICILSKLWKRG